MTYYIYAVCDESENDGKDELTIGPFYSRRFAETIAKRRNARGHWWYWQVQTEGIGRS